MNRKIFTIIIFAVMMFLFGVNAATAKWISLPDPSNLSKAFANFLPVILRSTSETYLFVPGTAFVKETSADATEWVFIRKAAQIYSGTPPGERVVYIPITLPAIIDGDRVRVTEVTVYYLCSDGEHNYIKKTMLTKYTEEPVLRTLAKDETPRQSNTHDHYTLSTTDANNLLSAGEGFLNLVLTLAFKSNAEYIQIGGVRLTLVRETP